MKKIIAIGDYLREHMVLQVGVNLSSHICSEIIVDDPKEFIQIVVQTEGYISAISWWERVAVDTKPKIGYGGQRDPTAPDKFYYAETDIVDCFPVSTSEYDYLNYLAQTLQSNPDVDLFPAFEVCKK